TAKSTADRGDFDWGLARFLDEARTLAKFSHPNIVQVHQVFESNSTAYIVMAYAQGRTLADVIKAEAPLDEARVRALLFPILDGLSKVHQQGFLHRDIKPGNIIVRDEEGPVLIDFGAARQAIETRSRSITSIVTEGYAPLEQYAPDGNQGPWTDIYALGAVAYKCLTGQTPPSATARVRNDPLVPAGEAAAGQASPAFLQAVDWALAVYEEERPQTIADWRRAFAGTLALRRRRPDDAARDATDETAADRTRLLAQGTSKHGGGDEGARRQGAIRRGGHDKRPAWLGMAGAGAGLAVVLVIAFFFLWDRASPEDREAWRIAAQEDTIRAYDSYMRMEPDGSYVRRAQKRIAAIRAAADKAWEDAVKSDSLEAYKAYYERYGKQDLHLADARAAIERLERAAAQRAAEDRIWQAARNADSLEAYAEYLRAYPQGRYKDQAQARVAALQKVQRLALAQEVLKQAGYYDGPIDGTMSAAMEAALRAFQQANGLEPTGKLEGRTAALIDQAAARIVEQRRQRAAEIRAAYDAAVKQRSRALYQQFLDNYGGESPLAADIRARLASCRIETRQQRKTSSTAVS
ncbi:MAG: hypothetical protein D6782_06455, partial [Alphaproteobacteria bacterium]